MASRNLSLDLTYCPLGDVAVNLIVIFYPFQINGEGDWEYEEIILERVGTNKQI